MINKKHTQWWLGGEKSPQSISGLLAWWRSTDGITKDGSNRVSIWEPKSGGSTYNLIQSGADSIKPIWTDSRYNGLPALVTDGVGQFMTTSAKLDAIQGIQKMTMFMVGKNAAMRQYAASTSIRTICQTNSGSNTCIGAIGNGSTATYTAPSDANHGYHIMRFDGTQGTDAGKVRINYKGVNQTVTFSGGSPASTTENTATTFDIQKYLTNYTAGEIVEMGIYTKTISDVEMNLLNEYLSARYIP